MVPRKFPSPLRKRKWRSLVGAFLVVVLFACVVATYRWVQVDPCSIHRTRSQERDTMILEAWMESLVAIQVEGFPILPRTTLETDSWLTSSWTTSVSFASWMVGSPSPWIGDSSSESPAHSSFFVMSSGAGSSPRGPILEPWICSFVVDLFLDLLHLQMLLGT